MHNKKNRAAFTLIEILIVVAIIGTLSAIIFVSVNRAQNKGNYTRILSDMKQISSAAETYAIAHNNSYPADVTVAVHIPELDSFLPGGWPNSPCSNYGYDYENWVKNGNGTCQGTLGQAPNQVVGVSFRALSSNIEKFYFNIKDNMGNCSETAATASDIKNKSPKEITCNE